MVGRYVTNEMTTVATAKDTTATTGQLPHTRKSIQAQTGRSEKTIREWVKKSGVVGKKIKNVEHFTDAQWALIVPQSVQKADEPVVEPEEPSADGADVVAVGHGVSQDHVLEELE